MAPLNFFDIAECIVFPLGLAVLLLLILGVPLALPRRSLAWQRTFGDAGFLGLMSGTFCAAGLAGVFAVMADRGIITHDAKWLLFALLLAAVCLNGLYRPRIARPQVTVIETLQPRALRKAA